MNETKLREKAANVSLELGLMGLGSDKIYAALQSVFLEERERAASIASNFTMKPDARIHPDIPFEKMHEIARVAAYTTAQQIAGEILEPEDAEVTLGEKGEVGRMSNGNCSYCGGVLGVDIIEMAGAERGFRHYSKIDCCDVLMIQRNAYKVQLEHLAKLADLVMKDLETHGPSIVPHLVDTDDNDGQRLREAVEKALLESSLKPTTTGKQS